MKILVFDPGESTGWVFSDTKTGKLEGGTSVRDHREIGNLIEKYMPDVIVYETFKLYPGLAKELAWNTFYPCEVIGVIRYFALLLNIKLVNQDAAVKKFAGITNIDYPRHWTVHTKDAHMHLMYYRRKNKIA